MSAYDITKYIDFSNVYEYKLKWDNSIPFKVSFVYECRDWFGKKFTK